MTEGRGKNRGEVVFGKVGTDYRCSGSPRAEGGATYPVSLGEGMIECQNYMTGRCGLDYGDLRQKLEEEHPFPVPIGVTFLAGFLNGISGEFKRVGGFGKLGLGDVYFSLWKDSKSGTRRKEEYDKLIKSIACKYLPPCAALPELLKMKRDLQNEEL